MRKNPREVAKILTEHMDLSDTYFTSVEIAGPGFLNFRLGDKWYADVLTAVEEEKGDYGRDNWPVSYTHLARCRAQGHR